MSSNTKKLFGDTVTCTLPSSNDFISADSLRQIPENQAVFVHKTLSNTSLIIEFLEPLAVSIKAAVGEGTGNNGPADDEKHAIAHFEEMALANDAQSFDITNASLVTDTVSMRAFSFVRTAVKGTQEVFKYGKPDQLDTVRMWVGVVAMPEFGTDLVVSLNSADDPTKEATNEFLESVFLEVFKSLTVVDFGLFAGESSEDGDNNGGAKQK